LVRLGSQPPSALCMTERAKPRVPRCCFSPRLCRTPPTPKCERSRQQTPVKGERYEAPIFSAVPASILDDAAAVRTAKSACAGPDGAGLDDMKLRGGGRSARASVSLQRRNRDEPGAPRCIARSPKAAAAVGSSAVEHAGRIRIGESQRRDGTSWSLTTAGDSRRRPAALRKSTCEKYGQLGANGSAVRALNNKAVARLGETRK
jgi:hypothetical protein